MRLKIYTTEGKFLKSKPFTDAQEFIDLLDDALTKFNPAIIYLSTSKSSKIVYHKQQLNRSAYFIRPDGTVTHTLSIHPHHYPITEVREDGTTLVHSLQYKKGITTTEKK